MKRILWLLCLAAVPVMAQNCTQTLTPNARAVPAATNPLFQSSFSVASNLTSCNWTSTATVPWIAVQVGQSGRGGGIVGYSVDNNQTPTIRTGTILVGNAAFTVTQAAATCAATLTLQGNSTIGAEGGIRQVQIATTCEWAPVTNVEWMTASPASGRGNGTVTLNIAQNNTTTSRSGAVGILGQNLTITQAGGTCSFTLTPTQQAVPAAGGAFSAGLTTACPWTATSNANWLLVTAPTSGSGASSINYTVGANTNSADARTGVITVGGSTVTVQQAGGTCSVQLGPTTARVASAGGAGSFSVTTPCLFTARSNATWITATAGNGTVTYSVATNTSVQPRTGTITAGGAVFTITQDGSACIFTVATDSFDAPPAGTSGAITVTTTSGCEWTAISDAPWIRITGTISGGAQGSLQYTVDPNTSGAARTGTLTVAGKAIAIRQTAGTAPRLTAGGIVNSASYQPGSVAPGEIVTIYGSDLGPNNLVTAVLENNAVTKSLGGTRILFDGVPAPLLYTLKGQVSAIVPYSVAGKSTVPVIAEYLGAPSAPVNVRILSASPGLYSLDSSGTGPGAIINQDGSVNSSRNPALAGQIVILYATGEGLTTPLQEDGRLTPGAEPLPRPRLRVSLTIGGVDCPILYAGAPPGLVAGAMQVNVQLPTNVPTGDAVPIVLGVGEALSPDTVTIAIRK